MNNTEKNYFFHAFYFLTIPAILYVLSIVFRLNEQTDFSLDIFVLKIIEPVKSEFIISIFTAITFFGSKWGIIFLLLCTLGWLWLAKKDYFGMILLFLAVIIGNELNKWLKDFYQRERPLIDPSIDAEGFSFPSGHAMVGIIFYGLLMYFILKELNSKKMKALISIVISFFILSIGYSRIILQAHYPTDVFGGFSLGFCLLALTIFVYKQRTRRVIKSIEKNPDITG